MEHENTCLGLGPSRFGSSILPDGADTIWGTVLGAWELKPNTYPNRAQWNYNASTHQLTMDNLNNYGLKTKGVSCLSLDAEQGIEMTAKLTKCLSKGDESYFTQNFTISIPLSRK